MGLRITFDPELEKLVQEVKKEMIEEGSRNMGNIIGRSRVIDKTRRVKLITENNWPIQFRGTPRQRENKDHAMLIRSGHDVVPVLRGEKKR